MEHQATYSPDDNKLRLYPAERLSAEDYAAVKKHGFTWAPKQGIFVKARWTPSAESFLVKMCGEIEDEDKSPEDRAADRAERFSLYRDNRRSEAAGYADTYDDGPAVIGCQSADRAERIARRFDRVRGRAVSQWDKAEYWQTRTAGVIANALHKATPQVRRSRILRIEADQRAHARHVAEARTIYAAWSRVAVEMDTEKAFKMAYAIANVHCSLYDFKHPRTDKTGSMYTLLTCPEPITGAEAAALFFSRVSDPDKEGSEFVRWTNHYTLRLAYEKQMLENEGGSAADAEMLPGGFIGKHQIQKVNRSPIDKRVVSISVWAEKEWWNGPGPAPMVLRSFNIQRLSKEAYRAPTAAELAAFTEAKKEEKTADKAARAANPAPRLINPTIESAQKLQDQWNEKAKARLSKYETYEPVELTLITQAQYAAGSVGTYAKMKTEKVDGYGNMLFGYRKASEKPFVKLRAIYPYGHKWSNAPYSIIVLTDKKQEALPAFQEIKADEKLVKVVAA